MKNNHKTRGGSWAVIIVAIVLVVSIVGALLYNYIEMVIIQPKYSTTNIEDYGDYSGTYNTRKIYDKIHSFFPAEIEDNFKNIKYSYKAQQKIDYAFEAYLEFTIEDSNEYVEFVNECTQGIKGKTFLYDTSFVEYVIADRYELSYLTDVLPDQLKDKPRDEADKEKRYIDYADIRKILCCPSENTIIFVILYSENSGDIDYLSTFFERFEINPNEYANQLARQQQSGDGSVIEP